MDEGAIVGLTCLTKKSMDADLAAFVTVADWLFRDEENAVLYCIFDSVGLVHC